MMSLCSAHELSSRRRETQPLVCFCASLCRMYMCFNAKLWKSALCVDSSKLRDDSPATCIFVGACCHVALPHVAEWCSFSCLLGVFLGSFIIKCVFLATWRSIRLVKDGTTVGAEQGICQQRHWLFFPPYFFTRCVVLIRRKELRTIITCFGKIE